MPFIGKRGWRYTYDAAHDRFVRTTHRLVHPTATRGIWFSQVSSDDPTDAYTELQIKLQPYPLQFQSIMLPPADVGAVLGGAAWDPERDAYLWRGAVALPPVFDRLQAYWGHPGLRFADINTMLREMFPEDEEFTAYYQRHPAIYTLPDPLPAPPDAHRALSLDRIALSPVAVALLGQGERHLVHAQGDGTERLSEREEDC